MKTGFQIIWLEEVDSTNSYAKRHISALDNLSVVAAVCQTAGRGQRGNRWLSKAGENLTFSVLLRPGNDGLAAISAENQFIISEAATIAVAEMLDGYGIRTKIKWPNDIYAGNKKICGMLVENTLSGGEVGSSIVGIGINVNQDDFPPQLINPCSMKTVTRQSYDIRDCLQQFLDIFSKYLNMISEAPEAIREKYLSMLYRKDERHQFADTIEDRVFNGIIRDISDNARLIVEMEDGTFKDFAFKEISYII